MIFDRIKNYIQELRISADFKQQQMLSWEKHKQIADERFSTAKLAKEISDLLARIESDAALDFDDNISGHETLLIANKFERSRKKETLAMLTRNFKARLDALYDSKQALLDEKRGLVAERDSLRKSLKQAFLEKDKAYCELNSAKEDIAHWYRKSERTPWLFGNGGKELPKHSLFGQSFGDLEGYKNCRDSASEDVREAKETIGRIKAQQKKLSDQIHRIAERVGDVINEISQTKTERSRMYALKKSGVTVDSLNVAIGTLNSAIRRAELDIIKLKDDRLEHVEQGKIFMGVRAKEEEIESIEEQKKMFLAEFDTPESTARRAEAHRKAWFWSRA